VSLTPTEPVGILGPPPPPNAPVFGRSSTLGFGQSSARSVGAHRPTAILPARRTSDTWFLKLVGASMVAAIAGAVWAGRLSWREHAIAAPAGPQHRPEIMAISGTEPPAPEAAGTKAVAAPAAESAPAATQTPVGTPAVAPAPAAPAGTAPTTDAQPPVGNPTSAPAAGTTSATSSPASTAAPAKPVAAPARKKRARAGAISRRTANGIAHGRLR
jgi:hypothetical protein